MATNFRDMLFFYSLSSAVIPLDAALFLHKNFYLIVRYNRMVFLANSLWIHPRWVVSKLGVSCISAGLSYGNGCYNLPHLALIQHVPPLHIGRNIVVLNNQGQCEKMLTTQVTLESTLTIAIVIFPNRVHLNNKNSYFLTTTFFPMTSRKHNFCTHRETLQDSQTIVH